jgi:hypothetical protein
MPIHHPPTACSCHIYLRRLEGFVPGEMMLLNRMHPSRLLTAARFAAEMVGHTLPTRLTMMVPAPWSASAPLRRNRGQVIGSQA